jgi:tetratricopeptide (TPR) repeat protein
MLMKSKWQLYQKTSLLFGMAALLSISCSAPEREAETSAEETAAPAAISLLGKFLYAAEPAERVLKKFREYKAAYEADPQNADNLIWFGRFTAYKGDYAGAIAIYTKGIAMFPNDPRMYRHRGHRYITRRKFDLAVLDFEQAAELIKDKPNEIEPDGMPNARNIPVSTLHGNIWYHLGLSYYLVHDLENALRAYQNCLATGTSPDNVVSATHWLTMILRRLGRQDEAEAYLKNITADMDVIENIDYHRICLFYKGELPLDELLKKEDNENAGDAIKYAVGNWYFYNGDRDKAKAVFEEILAGKSWPSFGYIAAEAHFVKEFL